MNLKPILFVSILECTQMSVAVKVKSSYTLQTAEGADDQETLHVQSSEQFAVGFYIV